MIKALYFCDKCKREFLNYKFINTYYYLTIDEKGACEIKEIHLCLDCNIKFNNWLNKED